MTQIQNLSDLKKNAENILMLEWAGNMQEAIRLAVDIQRNMILQLIFEESLNNKCFVTPKIKLDPKGSVFGLGDKRKK